jgi:hypothetical protein
VRRFRSIVTVLLAVAVPALCLADIMSMSLGDLARGSGVIFAGTVADVRSANAPGTIVTRVTFRDLAFGKGRTPGDSLVLTERGGTVFGRTEDDVDEPVFRPGERCIVFARAGLGTYADSYRAVVGGFQGVYYVEFDSTVLKPSIRQKLGMPVAGIRGEGIIVAEGKAAFTRMSEKDFLEQVSRMSENPRPTSGEDH